MHILRLLFIDCVFRNLTLPPWGPTYSNCMKVDASGIKNTGRWVKHFRLNFTLSVQKTWTWLVSRVLWFRVFNPFCCVQATFWPMTLVLRFFQHSFLLGVGERKSCFYQGLSVNEFLLNFFVLFCHLAFGWKALDVYLPCMWKKFSRPC